MTKSKFAGLAGMLLAGALALASGMAYGQGLYTNGLPVAGGSQYPSTLPLTGDEQIPADTMLGSGLNPATEAITTGQLAAFVGGSLDTWRNGLVGGNFATNLWQRGTTSASITTALTYTADRWWGLSGAGTAFKVIKQTSSQAEGIGASARVQRTAAQTGVLPVCVGQVLMSTNSYKYQGETVEFSFWAKAGADFSAASSLVTATIATGTGTDGTAANFSTGSWTGYAAAVASAVTIDTTWTRYSVVATIPTTAAQIGVKICYTPVGTAGTNDWFEFANAQLASNPNAQAYTGGSDTTPLVALAFENRGQNVETLLQQAYYFRVDESATITPIAPCAAIDVTHTNCYLTFPTTMRTTPTMTYTAGFASPTTTSQATLGACSALATAVTVTNATNNPNGVLITCTATTIPAAGVASFMYSNGGSGVIQANAEL